MRKTIQLFSALLVLSLSASAQQPSAKGSLLDHLAGKWLLKGTIAGAETTHDVDAGWVLNRGYIRLHEVSHEKNAQGEPAYEAVVFISWDPRANEYAVLWLDSTTSAGLSTEGIGRGTPSNNQIPFIFKVSGNESFHTTFVYDPGADTWQWIMDGEKDGALQPFARVRLTRVSRTPSSQRRRPDKASH